MDYAITPHLMGDKPGHLEQSVPARKSMYFSPQDTHTQVLHQLHVEMGLLSSRSAQLTLEHHAGFNKTEEERLFCGSFHTFQNQTGHFGQFSQKSALKLLIS